MSTPRTILTGMRVARFKLFDDVYVELGERVVLVGPNNAGKTSALQALALWHLGVKRWVEKRGDGPVPAKRPGVTINRRDLIALPVPTANILWRNRRVRDGSHDAGRTRTNNITVEIEVEGVTGGEAWRCGLEYDYANEESFYCRPLPMSTGGRMAVPSHLAALRLAYLPPMSGLSANEVRLEAGTIDVRIGEGRTAEVLRNLCYRVAFESADSAAWPAIKDSIERLFGVALEDPVYIPERGEITMAYRTRSSEALLDISSSGRGMQQTLLLLAHLAANPGAILLLDEPDAHLEILRQRQIYNIITDAAQRSGGQIIAASHSEVILNEAADRDTVVAFVGKPHRIDDRGSQVLKALKEIGFEHYYQAEERGWVLYLEGATDLAILRAFANRLDHPAAAVLESPFAHYVGNQPRKAQDHFYALREAKADLRAFALYDRLEQSLPLDPNIQQHTWRRREIECYVAQRETLLAYADALGMQQVGDLFASQWQHTMAEAIAAIERALADLGKGSPWEAGFKVSDDFLTPLFHRFFADLRLPNLMNKSDFHQLVAFVPADHIDPEIGTVLDRIAAVADAAS